MVEQGNAVVRRESEPGRVGSDVVHHGSRVVEHAFQHLDGDLRDCVRVDVVGEEIADHPPCPGGGQTTHDDAILAWDGAAMQPDVRAPTLAPDRERELVDVRAQVANPVQRSGGRVGDDSDERVIEADPCRLGRVELQPCRAQCGMVRRPGAADTVHAVADTLERSGPSETGQRGPRHTGPLGLLASDQPPLGVGDVHETLQRSSHTANYTIFSIVCSMKRPPRLDGGAGTVEAPVGIREISATKVAWTYATLWTDTTPLVGLEETSLPGNEKSSEEMSGAQGGNRTHDLRLTKGAVPDLVGAELRSALGPTRSPSNTYTLCEVLCGSMARLSLRRGRHFESRDTDTTSLLKKAVTSSAPPRLQRRSRRVVHPSQGSPAPKT
jgi:hypothetical protein